MIINDFLKLTIILILFFIFGCARHDKIAREKFSLARSEGSFEHGKNLVFNMCGSCHYDPKTKRFSGKKMNDVPGFIGKVYSANLTSSINHGVLANYTSSEFAYLLKTGRTSNGKFVPYMLRPNLAEADITDILVYLRSTDTPLMSLDSLAGKTHISFIGKIAMRIAGKPLPYHYAKRPDDEDSVETGKYLVDNLGCFHCHSKSITALNYFEPEKSKGYMLGGMKFKEKDGNKFRSPNLTADIQTGIGYYTREDFREAVRNGIRPGCDSLRPPMPKFKHMTDAQVDAIFIYLNSLPTQHHKPKKEKSGKRWTVDGGQKTVDG